LQAHGTTRLTDAKPASEIEDVLRTMSLLHSKKQLARYVRNTTKVIKFGWSITASNLNARSGLLMATNTNAQERTRPVEG